MEGSIHPDKWGYRVHFRGKWYRRGPLRDGKVIAWKHNHTLAEQFLIRLNWEGIEGSFDERNYQKNNPLGLANLAEQWLETRKGKVRCYRNLSNHMGKAISYFGNTNIRAIRFASLEYFYSSLREEMAEKTKRNIFTTLHSFWRWVCDNEEDKPNPITMPKFPQIKKGKPNLRKIVTPQDQAMILDKMKEIVPAPKAYLAAMWMITYGLRWIELRPIKLKDFNNGFLRVWDWKQENYKEKKLLPDDWALIEQDTTFPEMYFFRHPTGEQLGRDYPYSWLKKASVELGFDVHPYAIVRHSTITNLSDYYTPEEIKRNFSLHLHGLYDYLHTTEDKKQAMYARARPGGVVEMRREDNESL